VEGVRWAARDEIPLRLDAPEYLVANLVEQPSRQRRMVHLVNYNAKNVPAVATLEVWCSLPQGAAAKEVALYSPDARELRQIEFRAHGAGISFEVPRVETYAVAVVSW
jgi:hypothetical protein